MKHKRILALVLSVALLLSNAAFTPAQATQVAQDENTEATQTSQDNPSEEIKEPLIVNPDLFVHRDHTERLHSEEGNDLNKLVFRNEDGSKTMYIYDLPVKYRDELGQTHDISLEIADTEDSAYPFRTKANSVVTEFPASLSDGITLSGNGVTLRLVAPPPTALTTLSHSARRVDKNTIAYTYDNQTTIEYALTYTGFKEDIVVSEYTGQTEYPFILYTNGLNLTEIDGSYYLTDEDGTVHASIGDITVFTADERNNTLGTLQTTTIKPGQIYALTIVLDAEYLADPNTVYPIRIDPTVELVYTDENPNVIEERTIQSNNTQHGSNASVFIGYGASGINRLLMRFPGIDFDALEGVTVTSAVVSLRDLMCETEAMTVTCYPFTGTVWDESSSQWSNITQSWGTALDSHVISYDSGRQQESAHRYCFDITSLAQKWVDGYADPAKGIIFRAESSVESGPNILYKTFASSERSGYRPTFEITYQGDISLNKTVLDMDEGSRFTLTANSLLNNISSVTWSSSNTSAATVSTGGVVTGIKAGESTITAIVVDTDGVAQSLTCKVYVTIADGIYYIKDATYGLCPQGSIGNPRLYAQKTNQSTRINQLWKIAYVSGGLYVLRPLQDFSVILQAQNGYAAVADATASNNSVATYLRWSIVYDSSGYVFKQAGSNSQVMKPAVPGMSGSQVLTSTVSGSTGYHWSLENAAGVFLRDANTLQLINAQTVIYTELDFTRSLGALGLSAEYYGDNPVHNWTSSNTAIATVDNSGKTIAINRGETSIKITMTSGSIIYTSQFTLSVIETIYVVNLYDSTIANDTAILNKITPTIDFLNTIYGEQFNLRFVTSTIPHQYTGGVDQCPNGANNECSYSVCGNSCLNHHKNVFRIADDLYTQYGTPNQVVAMWSNCPLGTFCESTVSVHFTTNAFGLNIGLTSNGVEYRLPIVQILTVNNYTADSAHGSCSDDVYMAIVLAHEIAHSLGLGEIYENAYGDDPYDHADASNDGMQCIMDLLHFGSMQNLYDSGSAALCEYCRSKLENEIPDNVYELLPFDTIIPTSLEGVTYEILY